MNGSAPVIIASAGIRPKTAISACLVLTSCPLHAKTTGPDPWDSSTTGAQGRVTPETACPPGFALLQNP